MVWDEISKDWVPRWGYGSIKKIQKRADIVRTVKPGEDPNADPWEKDKIEKEMGANKQKMAEMANKLHKKNISPAILKRIDKKDQEAQQKKTMRNNRREKKGANLKQKKEA